MQKAGVTYKNGLHQFLFILCDLQRHTRIVFHHFSLDGDSPHNCLKQKNRGHRFHAVPKSFLYRPYSSAIPKCNTTSPSVSMPNGRILLYSASMSIMLWGRRYTILPPATSTTITVITMMPTIKVFIRDIIIHYNSRNFLGFHHSFLLFFT